MKNVKKSAQEFFDEQISRDKPTIYRSRAVSLMEQYSSYCVGNLNDQLNASKDRIVKLESVVKECELQIEYLHGKFQETGSGNSVLNMIKQLDIK